MATRVNTSYCSAVTVRSLLGIDNAIEDAKITGAIDAASRYVDSICLRPGIGGARGGFWYIAAATAVFRPQPGWPAAIGDWAAIGTVSISVDGGVTYSDLATTGWQAEPLNAALVDEPYNEVRRCDYLDWPPASFLPGRPCLRVVGTYGWASVPSEAQHAAELVTMRWYKRPDSPLGIAGFGDVGGVYVRGSDPDVERILHRLIVRRVG